LVCPTPTPTRLLTDTNFDLFGFDQEPAASA
jgi:hypothetical protein